MAGNLGIFFTPLVAQVRFMHQPPLDSYSGGVIDISGLVPGSSGIHSTSGGLKNNLTELDRYKSQQYAMYATQYGTQVDLLRSIDPHREASEAAAAAQKTQSASEIGTADMGQSAVQATLSEHKLASHLQHQDLQQSQIDLSRKSGIEQHNMTYTVHGFSRPHQSAYLDTAQTTASVMNQQRADQLAALEQTRRQQMTMLSEYRTSSGLSYSSTGSSDPQAHFLSSTSPSMTPSSHFGIYTTPTSSVTGQTLNGTSNFQTNSSSFGSPTPYTSSYTSSTANSYLSRPADSSFEANLGAGQQVRPSLPSSSAVHDYEGYAS